MASCSNSKKARSWLISLFMLFFVLSLISVYLPAQEAERVSKFGEYRGYSKEIYDSWVRSSQYLTMRDGTKLAIDIIRPAREGKVAREPLPVIWTHNRYRRAFKVGDKVRSMADSALNQPLLKHGYIIASVDVRGSGASFGSWQGIFTKEETQDAYEITEWLASQPWCNGNIGMFGGSYLGITQLMTASTKPPHLKAIFPIVALFDMYAFGYPGGVFYDDLISTWSELTKQLDTEMIAAPVDEDKDETLLKAAIEEHKLSRSLMDIFSPLKFRNSKDEFTGVLPFYEWHPAAFVKEINESGVPMYLWCGWFDSFTRCGFFMFRNFTTAKKMVMGAWSHSPRDPKIAREDFGLAAVEQMRWFDYWLKGIDNGIMDEAPISYHVMRAAKDNEWRTAYQWPLPGEKPIKYYLLEGPSGSVKSVNDGIMSKESASGKTGKDDYSVNYTTTTGQNTRWDNAVGGGFNYPDMRENDEKALTYTTVPLTEDLEITGHPVVHLWISSTATDGDFFAYLEEVDANGASHYVSEGTMRASHRALHEPYYDNLGLPFHRSHEEDVVDLAPGEPVKLVFDLQPTSNIFNTGNRIRITIACADKDNAQTPELSPPPMVTVYRNSENGSYVLLPVFSVGAEAAFPVLFIMLVVLGIVVLIIIFTAFMRRKTT